MNDEPRFEKLFDQFQIGKKLKLRNRIVMPGMTTNFGSKDGFVTERLTQYYEERARGGVGLIITEPASVSQQGRMTNYQIGASDDRYLAGLGRLTRAIHKHGAKVFLQVHHAGRASVSRITGMQPVAPSAIPALRGEMPHPLTTDEIAELVGLFVRAAERAKKAEFDGVEVYAAHMGLVAQFLSAASNKRGDQYGGDLKNRARLLVEIVRAIKTSVGQDYPLSCRINAREYGVPDGTTIEEAQQVAVMIQQAGADMVDVSAYGVGSHANLAPQPPDRGAFLPLAEAVKKVLGIPVMVAGRIDPELGEEVVRGGKADLIAIGRGLLADPELPFKAVAGRLDDITPCIGCLQCIDHILFKGEPVQCTVNAAVGREQQYRISPAKRTRKVLVVGGGPGGMEAARVAALRGHEVTLLEKSNELGGRLLLACVAPGKSDIRKLALYLANEVKKRGVRVELGKEATPEVVRGLEPDALVLATGATPAMPQIRNVDRNNVVLAEDVLSRKVEVGQKVVVLGGELVGCETADLLSQQSKNVTITLRGPRMAKKMMPISRRVLLDRLAARGVVVLSEVQYEEITAEGLVIVSKEGERRLLEADTVVIAAGSKPDDKLSQAISGRIREVHLVGDCREPRDILSAIAEGCAVGHEV